MTHIIISTFFNPEGCIRLLQSIEKFTNLKKVSNITVLELSQNSIVMDLIQSLLQTLSTDFKNIIQIESLDVDLNKAYTLAQSKTSATYSCFLHDDVVVTKDWLDLLTKPLDNDSNIAITTPITNYDEFSGVEFFHGVTASFVAELLKKEEKYINARAISDFCVLIRNETIETYGFLDESYKNGFYAFTDLHFRLITQGKRSVVVTNAFVYHKGKDLTEQEKENKALNRQILMKRYKDVYDSLDKNEHTEFIRSLNVTLQNKENRSVDVLIIMPSNNPSGGGVKITHQIANALNESGISTTIATTWHDRFDYRIDALYTAIYYKELYELYDLKPKVIAYSLDHNAYEVVRYIDHLQKKHGYTPKILHFAQDVEGWFEHHDMKSFIQFADLGDISMSVSPFVTNVIKQYLPKKEIITINNSISANFIAQYAKNAFSQEESQPITFTAMMREDQKRGAAVVDEALEILDKKLSSEKSNGQHSSFNLPIRFIGFGRSHLLNKTFEHIQYFEHFRIPEHKVSEILAQSDVYIEPSYYQGFGLTAVEALCSNCDVLSSTNEGAMSVLPKTERIKYFPVGNAQELANAMLEYIQTVDIAKRRSEKLQMETLLPFMNRKVFSRYYDLIEKLIKSKDNSAENYAQRALQVMLAYYSFVEKHYLFDPQLRLRYRLADKISNRLGRVVGAVKGMVGR